MTYEAYCLLHTPVINKYRGNHDVGISRWFNPHAMERFEKTFGKTNYVVRAGKFDLVVRSDRHR